MKIDLKKIVRNASIVTLLVSSACTQHRYFSPLHCRANCEEEVLKGTYEVARPNFCDEDGLIYEGGEPIKFDKEGVQVGDIVCWVDHEKIVKTGILSSDQQPKGILNEKDKVLYRGENNKLIEQSLKEIPVMGYVYFRRN